MKLSLIAMVEIFENESKLPTPFDNLLSRHYQKSYFNPTQAPKGAPGERNREPSAVSLS